MPALGDQVAVCCHVTVASVPELLPAERVDYQCRRASPLSLDVQQIAQGVQLSGQHVVPFFAGHRVARSAQKSLNCPSSANRLRDDMLLAVVPCPEQTFTQRALLWCLGHVRFLPGLPRRWQAPRLRHTVRPPDPLSVGPVLSGARAAAAGPAAFPLPPLVVGRQVGQRVRDVQLAQNVGERAAVLAEQDGLAVVAPLDVDVEPVVAPASSRRGPRAVGRRASR